MAARRRRRCRRRRHAATQATVQPPMNGDRTPCTAAGSHPGLVELREYTLKPEGIKVCT